jgi:O-acetyl-ADP-ribose deacetylase (regulator of RNase III)
MTIYDEVGHLGITDGDIMLSECQTLTCPVNVVGVMGAGLAKTMAREYPGLLHAYRQACRSSKLKVTSLWVYKLPDGRQILCFPTKKHWKDPSRIEWVEHNLKLLSQSWEELNITSLAIPRLGCGLGGLDWDKEVLPLVYKYLDKIPIPVYVYIK